MSDIKIVGPELRTFSNKKGADKAAKRDLAKLPETIYVTGYEVQESEGRCGVVVFLDHSEAEFESLTLDALQGFGVRFERKEEPAPKPEPKAEPAPKPQRKRSTGEINVKPSAKAYPARAGTIQAEMIRLLADGATMGDLRRVCVRRDGRVWDDNSIRSGCYYDVANKGYGVRTEWLNGHELWERCSFDDDTSFSNVVGEAVDKVLGEGASTHPDEWSAGESSAIADAAMDLGYDPDEKHPVYFLILPEGMDAPHEPKGKS